MCFEKNLLNLKKKKNCAIEIQTGVPVAIPKNQPPSVGGPYFVLKKRNKRRGRSNHAGLSN